jgi:uncharacterized protein YgbK (DUF1537 family)
MIVVIADDFTGAAELGGIGLRYNLKVEVNTRVNLQSTADLLIVATDTRSMSKAEAVAEMEKVTEEVAKLNPTLIYKKVDSVLRGYVAEELIAHIQKLNYSGALLVPANPGLGRTIVNGQYLVNNEPLHLTHFAKDPEFPAKTSSVIGLLDNRGINISSQKHTKELNFEGITIGDAVDHDELKAWAQRSHNLLLAGASNFFTALLDQLLLKKEPVEQVKPRVFENPMLIVSGTAFKKSTDAIRQLKADGSPVSYMPAKIVCQSEINESEYLQWSNQILGYIAKFGKAIIAIDPQNEQITNNQSPLLRAKTAIIVALVLKQLRVSELLIEGGSTAAAILKQAGISKMFPLEELAPGVIRMSADDDSDMYITIKPGSYAWPPSVSQYTSY